MEILWLNALFGAAGLAIALFFTWRIYEAWCAVPVPTADDGDDAMWAWMWDNAMACGKILAIWIVTLFALSFVKLTGEQQARGIAKVRYEQSTEERHRAALETRVPLKAPTPKLDLEQETQTSRESVEAYRQQLLAQ